MRKLQFTNTYPERVQKLADDIRSITPGISLEHARAEIEVYESCKDDPRIIQRAKVLANLLNRKKITIYDGELIVGNVTEKKRASLISGELFANILDKELDDPVKDPNVRQYDRHYITDEERKELRETIIPYFRGRTLADYTYSLADDDVKEHGFLSVSSCPHIPSYADVLLWQDAGHVCPNHEKVLTIGLKGIREEVEWFLAKLDQPYIKFGVQQKKDFYNACLIVIDAAIAFTKRYSDLARELAEKETDEKRKKELLKIAEVCARVPTEPARDWWEALQSIWFINVILNCEQFNFGIGMMARFDQFMLPFYQKSHEDGMTDDELLELLECFFVKTASFTQFIDYGSAACQSGFPMGQTMMIGGQIAGGKDGTNEVTWLALEADENVGLFQPDIGFRVWEGTPDDILKKCWKINFRGLGKPNFFGERASMVECKKKYPDLTYDELLEHCGIGCFELQLTGVGQNHGYAGVLNSAKIVEMVIFNGKCACCGKQIGPLTGDPRSFESMEAFKQAVRTQMFYWTEQMCKAVKCEIDGISTLQPAPFASVVHEGPVAAGKDLLQGGAMVTEYGVITAGLTDGGDSMAVIDTLIFKEKKITWDQLITALKANWEGYEDLRQMCVNEVPKYGNDDDYADSWVAFLMNTYADAVDSMNLRKDMIPSVGGFYTSGTVNGNSHVGMGPLSWAMPNGRKNPAPLSDTLSPVQGVDVEGATAVLKSMSKLPIHRMTVGAGMNQRLDPSMFTTEEDLDRLVAYIRTFEELGLEYVQYNMVTTEILKDAQKHPEQYRHLLVRVATFLSNFVELSPTTQDQIIARTEHRAL